MTKQLITCEFRVGGEVVESVQSESVPRVGETVEIGTKFNENGRIDPSNHDAWHDFNSEYKTVLSGVVKDVTRHYCSAPQNRAETTAYIDVETSHE